jgi:hypothetical protein
MNNIKTPLRIMLTFASMAGFLGGWATLAHSRKPVQSTTPSTDGGQAVDALPPLAPLAPINISGAASNSGNGNLTIVAPPLQPQQRLRSRAPLFSSGGS